MITDSQIISKGIYRYAQIDSFIAVKDYIFARREDKKCLFLRFVNNADYRITSMSFTVLQMNASGDMIGKINIDLDSQVINPGVSYTYGNGIVIDEYCSDFRVVFSCVRSDDYIYLVRDGRVTVNYDLPRERIRVGKPAKKSFNSSFRTKKKRYGRPRLAMFFAVCALILLLLFNSVYSLVNYIDDARDSGYNIRFNIFDQDNDK